MRGPSPHFPEGLRYAEAPDPFAGDRVDDPALRGLATRLPCSVAPREWALEHRGVRRELDTGYRAARNVCT